MQRNNTQRLLPTLPGYNALQAGIATLERNYKGVNLNRMELINLIKAVDAYLQGQPTLVEDEKREILLAAYVFSLERIETERWVGQGSSVRDIVYSILGISDDSTLDNASRLILLSQWRDFLATDVGQNFRIAREPLKSRVEEIQSMLVTRLKPEIKKIEHALPNESVLDEKLSGVVAQYRKIKNLPENKYNQKRLIEAQFLQTMAMLNPAQDGLSAEIFAPSSRIKMGAILFIMREIGSANSKLYQLCQNMLNIKHPDDIHPDLEKICLLALRNYLNNTDAAAKLEFKAREIFGAKNKLVNLEIYLDNIRKQINEKTFAPESPLFQISTLSVALAAIGGVILAAPCYGSGQALGATLAQTDFAVKPTHFVAANMHWPIRVCLGGVGNYVGNFAASLVINKTLESAFGFAVATLGFTIGATTGAVVGFTLFQVTPALVREICKLCLDMHSQITDPVLAAKVDTRILESLLVLPDNVFSPTEKNNLEYITGFSLFKPVAESQQDTSVLAARAAAADEIEQKDDGLRQSNGV